MPPLAQFRISMCPPRPAFPCSRRAPPPPTYLAPHDRAGTPRPSPLSVDGRRVLHDRPHPTASRLRPLPRKSRQRFHTSLGNLVVALDLPVVGASPRSAGCAACFARHVHTRVLCGPPYNEHVVFRRSSVMRRYDAPTRLASILPRRKRRWERAGQIRSMSPCSGSPMDATASVCRDVGRASRRPCLLHRLTSASARRCPRASSSSLRWSCDVASMVPDSARVHLQPLHGETGSRL